MDSELKTIKIMRKKYVPYELYCDAIQKCENIERKLKEEIRKREPITKVDGFQLILQDYCKNCGDFVASVERIECSNICDRKYLNIIRCGNCWRCERIAEDLNGKINE